MESINVLAGLAGVPPVVVALAIIWTLVWKGLALWKAARNDERYWYLALLLINTAGILEILYLFFFAKEKLVLISEAKTKSRSKKSSTKS